MAFGFIAFKFAAVSEMLSPLAVELLLTSRRITSAPKRLAAISKLESVRVEFSKKMVIMVLFLRISLCCISLYTWALFKIDSICDRLRSLVRSRCFGARVGVCIQILLLLGLGIVAKFVIQYLNNKNKGKM